MIIFDKDVLGFGYVEINGPIPRVGEFIYLRFEENPYKYNTKSHKFICDSMKFKVVHVDYSGNVRNKKRTILERLEEGILVKCKGENGEDDIKATATLRVEVHVEKVFT